MEHLDVLVVGAGLAGLGFAHHLQEQHSHRSFAILEARDRLGGTWDLFRYPGVRSDVDLHLYGYAHRPWTGRIGVAPAEDILGYLDGMAEDEGLSAKVRTGHKVLSADWSNEDARWVVTCERPDGGTVRLSCSWLQMCAGYYSYAGGHAPDFAGQDRFGGQIVHPQAWPDDLDLNGKKVVVIGSGATAITLIPAIARQAAHVTMLQRSPSYVYGGPSDDRWTRLLRRLLPTRAAYAATRWKNLQLDRLRYWMSVHRPETVKAQVRKAALAHLPEGFDFERHFAPAHEPHEQRVCLVPDGDLFRALGSGRASVVTDRIEAFEADGIRLASGEKLEADVIVTATGLKMAMAGEAKFAVDGEPFAFADKWVYRGVMFSGVPNMALTVGTLVHPYTLRVEMIARWVCRVLAHMDEVGARVAVPELPMAEADMPARPFTEEFSSGYILRAIERFPKQGDADPWLNHQSYDDNKRMFGEPVADGTLRFGMGLARTDERALQAAEAA